MDKQTAVQSDLLVAAVEITKLIEDNFNAPL